MIRSPVFFSENVPEQRSASPFYRIRRPLCTSSFHCKLRPHPEARGLLRFFFRNIVTGVVRLFYLFLPAFSLSRSTRKWFYPQRPSQFWTNPWSQVGALLLPRRYTHSTYYCAYGLAFAHFSVFFSYYARRFSFFFFLLTHALVALSACQTARKRKIPYEHEYVPGETGTHDLGATTC